MKLMLVWLINAVSLLLVAHFMPGVHVTSFFTALLVALVLGLVNSLLRPVLLILTLPINIVTLGLFTLVVNGFCFWLVAEVLKGFYVSSFIAAVFGALAYSVITWLASAMLMQDDK